MWLRENIAILVTQNVFSFFLILLYFFCFLVACSSYCNGFSKVCSGFPCYIVDLTGGLEEDRKKVSEKEREGDVGRRRYEFGQKYSVENLILTT